MLLSAVPSSAHAQTSIDLGTGTGSFVDTTVASGLHGPTAMEFSPDGRLFVSQEGGNVTIVKNGQTLPAPFLTVPTITSNEMGLLGITLDPNFAANGYVYVYYTVQGATDSQAHNRVSRFTADPSNPDRVLAGSEKVLLNMDQLTPSLHNGGGLHFGPDGRLYIATGDNYVWANAQSLNTDLGKMLRINSDGSIPQDNPFYNVQGAKKEIWATGLRNPFTFAFSPLSGVMYINDVGQESWEEINEGVAGANYGWPLCEGFCSNANFTNPIYVYPHNGAPHAITGGAFYEGSQFPPQYRGSYFFGDFAAGFIKRLTPEGTAVDFLQNVTSPVDIDVGPDGSLYYLSIGSGEVHQVQYVNPALLHSGIGPVDSISGPAPLKVKFESPRDQPGASYLWNFGDGSEQKEGAEVSYTYKVPGTYVATMTAAGGGSSTIIVTVGEHSTPALGGEFSMPKMEQEDKEHESDLNQSGPLGLDGIMGPSLGNSRDLPMLK
jgi:glucose/arabinose dehydrogenase